VKSTHAKPETNSKLSPREARAEARTKLKHDRDAGEASTSAKSVKRKGKEIARDDDFIEEEVIPKPAKKKIKVSPTVKPSKKKKVQKSPKTIPQQSLEKVKF